jgi:hypothetical protein
MSEISAAYAEQNVALDRHASALPIRSKKKRKV